MSEKEDISKYLKVIEGTLYFCGNDEDEADFNMACFFAQECNNYTEDVEDEIHTENMLTCYNCRYRRWANVGFSCLKGFPFISK